MNDLPAALTPVRDALLEAAAREAGTLASAADEDAARVRRRTEEEERRIRREARDRGRAEGLRRAQAGGVEARREARAAVHRAQREAYDELRRQVLARLEALRQEPTYPVLLEDLARQARTLLGPGAEVTEAPEGGLVAEADGRRLDLTLPALVEEALTLLGGELEDLWRP